jgi:hypothetical protein
VGFYFLPKGNAWIGIGKSGRFFATDDLVTGTYSSAGEIPNEKDIRRWRHGDVFFYQSTWYAVYSCLGDTPERIRIRSFKDFDKKGHIINPSEPSILLAPEHEYEGSKLPIVTSQNGEAKVSEHALRDPAVLIDDDGRVYIAYAVKGEFGIALAELIPHKKR